MNKNEFLTWERISSDTIDVKRIYIDIAGDLVTGVLLSQLVYWYLPSKGGADNKLSIRKGDDKWIAKERNDWWDECRISSKQYDRSIKILKDLGLVDTAVFRFNNNPTAHVKLDLDVLLEYIESLTALYVKEVERINKETGLPYKVLVYLPEGKNVIDQTVKTLLTKRQERYSPKVNNVIPQAGITELPKGEEPNSPNVKNDIPQRSITLTKTTPEITSEITSERDALTLWTNTLIPIQENLTLVTFNTWISTLLPVIIDGDIFILSAPNEFTKSMVINKYSALILKSLTMYNSNIKSIVIKTRDRE